MISSERAPRPVGPYSQAIKAGGFLFVSGQLGMKGGRLGDGVAEQTELALEAIRAILEEAGMGMEHVVKVTVFMRDLAEFEEMNRVYSRYFEKDPPARSTIQAILPRGALIEMDVIAYKG